uniref:Butyrophilin subfamily 1 member A1 n=1 Tax=Gopherus evgoodei TaxID=1825980 RepID=A0A8C4Y7H4_9SAUR
GQQMPEYLGRTELLKDDITNGSVSLRIRNIQPSDDGQYKCFFKSSVSYEEALLELQVAGLGSAPAIAVEGHQDGGIRVVCRSIGWYPKPEAQWRDLQGQLLPSTSEKISPEANGLFRAEIAIVLTEESNQKVSCCVRNPRLNQERESEISLAGQWSKPPNLTEPHPSAAETHTHPSTCPAPSETPSSPAWQHHHTPLLPLTPRWLAASLLISPPPTTHLLSPSSFPCQNPPCLPLEPLLALCSPLCPPASCPPARL